MGIPTRHTFPVGVFHKFKKLDVGWFERFAADKPHGQLSHDAFYIAACRLSQNG